MASAPPSYFVDHKKGEVNELKTSLRRMAVERNPALKRDLIKKVIAYMTLGIDVSRLYSEMVLAANTRDLVVKKMVYLYLCKYASSHPDLTLLAINTLQKDSRDEDPMVRGLALRSLCSLQLPSILEYVLSPLKASLTDSSAYVRRNGVMGVLKVFALSPDVIRDSGMVDTLYNMIRDRDPQVVANCIMVLNEIMRPEGGIAINQAIIHHLMNRVRDFNEWSQCTVLSLVAKYKPADADETFKLMNLLDQCLRVSNSAVVLATCDAFIKLTMGMPEIQAQVYARLKTPLLTLMAAATPELCHCVLSHIVRIVPRCPGVFDAEFKQFFCRYHEPTCVKHLKMDVLPQLANASNLSDVLAELSEYVSDVDADMARHAIRAIAQVVVRHPDGAESVVECLLELTELDIDYVRSETVIVMKDLLRKYPSIAPDVLPALEGCLKRVEEPPAKAAVLWMFGEFGQLIENAPYLLEPLIDAVAEEASTLVRLALLTATMKLFFKRAPEVQRMLGRLLRTCLEDTSSAAVHDRALMYYRLLRKGVDDAAAVVGAGETKPVATFLEEMNNDVKDKVYAEFNTLSCVYGEPAETFIDEEYKFPPPAMDGFGMATLPPAGDESKTDGKPAGAAAATAEPGPGAGAGAGGDASGGMDLLGFDMFGTGAPAPAPAPAKPALALASGATIAPQEYQGQWLSLPAQPAVNVSVANVSGTAPIEAAMLRHNIACMASGDTGPQFKFYFFAKDGAGVLYLMETLVDKASKTATNQIKCAAGGNPTAFAELVQAALQSVA